MEPTGRAVNLPGVALNKRELKIPALKTAHSGGLAGIVDRTAFACLCLLVFAIPWEEVIPLVGGFVISRWMGMLAIGAGLLRLIVWRQVRKPHKLHYLMTALVAWSIVSVVWSADPETTIARQGTYLRVLVMVVLIWELALTQWRLNALLGAYVAGSVVSAAETVRNAMMGRTAGAVYETQGLSVEAGQRYTAGGFNLNDLGLLLVLSVPMSVYLLTRAKRGSSLYCIHLALSLTAIILTASRGATVALAVALAILPLAAPYCSRRKRLLAVAALAVCTCAAAALVPAATWERLLEIGGEIQAGTLTHRTTIWSAGMEVFRQHPISGVGSGAFPATVVAILDRPFVAHNTFISVLVELGVIGEMLMAALLLAMLYCAFGLPALEKRFWIVLLATWAVGVSAGTWEYRKCTWLLFGALAAQVSVIETNRANTRRISEAVLV